MYKYLLQKYCFFSVPAKSLLVLVYNLPTTEDEDLVAEYAQIC